MAQFTRNEEKLQKAKREFETKKESTMEEMNSIVSRQVTLLPQVMKTFFEALYGLQESCVDYQQFISKHEMVSRFEGITAEDKEDMHSDISNNQKRHQVPQEGLKKSVTKTVVTKTVSQSQSTKALFAPQQQ